MRYNVQSYILSTGVPFYEMAWKHIYDNFIDTKGSYQNLNTNGFISVQTIILFALVILALSAVFIYSCKISYGKLIKQLTTNGCSSREDAKTLAELDLADKLLLRYALKYSATLRRVVLCVEEEDFVADLDKKTAEYEKLRKENPSLPKKFTPKPFKMNFDENRFYIPEDRRIAAELQFAEKKNAPMKMTLLVIGFVAVIVAFIVFCPEIMTLLDSLAAKIFGGTNA